jgi:cobalt-zinc-cadmium efflux system outer membrane protein
MRNRPWAIPGALVAAMLSTAAPVCSQPLSAPEHPIKRGFEAAWNRQPERQVADLRRDAATSAVEASQRWLPEPAALEVTAKTDRYASDNGAREYDAGVAIPLWLPGERSRAQSAAQAEANAVGAGLAAARWRLAEQTRDAYWELARAFLERQLAEERFNNARLLAVDVAKRQQAGDLARADGHQAEGAAAGAEAAVAEAQAAFGRATRRWRSLTGEASAQDVTPAAESIPGATAAPSDHPFLAQLAAKAEAARRQRDLASVQTRTNPELTVGAVRERGDAGEAYSRSLVVGVRIPLGTSTASRTRIATASADQQEAEAVLAFERQKLDADVESAREDVRALEAAAQAAERRAQLGRESRGFYEKSFRLGESDLPTRLRVELEAFEAERQSARARIELSAAISRLRQALGLLPE